MYADGMPPARRVIETPLAPLTIAATDRGICLVEMGTADRVSREQAELEHAFGEPFYETDHPLLDRLEEQLHEYFAGTRTEFSVPLDTPGTAWQRRVWGELGRIPFGHTVSYGQLAARLGNPNGSRAVGLANGRNRVSIVIPCHRVIASDGTLHGYGGGLDRKRWLLDHEATHAPTELFACR